MKRSSSMDNLKSNSKISRPSITAAAAAADDDDVAIPSTEEEVATNNSDCFREYYTRENDICSANQVAELVIKFERLPNSLRDLIENHIQPTISNCDSVFPGNVVPFFHIKHGINPIPKWYNTFRIFVEKNFHNSFLTIDEEKCTTTYNKSPVLNEKRTILNEANDQRESSAHTTKHLNVDQLEILRNIVRTLFPPISGQKKKRKGNERSSESSYKPFNIFVLDGAAGTGKTFALSRLKAIKRIQVYYVTISNFLCHDVKKKYGVQTITFCSFLMKYLKINFPLCKLLQDAIRHIDHQDIMDKLTARDISILFEKQTNLKWIKFMQLNGEETFPTYLRNIYKYKETVVYILDEFSLIPVSLIILFLRICECFTIVGDKHVTVVVTGHGKQIQPLYAVPNHKHSFLKNIAQFNHTLNQQQRVIDTEYETILNQIIDDEINNDNLMKILKKHFADKNCQDIEYVYPIHKIHGSIPKKLKDIVQWFESEKIHTICDIMMFSFTNKELQFNNLSLAKSIHYQLSQYESIAPKDYVQFQILKHVISGNILMHGFPIDNVSNDKIPILPLIRFFPYKILAHTVKTLPRSSIVFLITWTKESVVVYSRTNKTVYELEHCTFRMNLYRTGRLYGFPLQLHVGETFHSCQGLTLEKNIYANFSKATREQIYVVLSRVPRMSNCKSIYFPELYK